MDKKFRETRLQLQLSPVVLRSCEKTDNFSQNAGHLLLTGLQFRGHAMFSEIDRPLGKLILYSSDFDLTMKLKIFFAVMTKIGLRKKSIQLIVIIDSKWILQVS